MPAPPQIISNAVQVRIMYTLPSGLAINVLGGVVAGGFIVNQTVANTLGSAIKTAFTTNLGALVTNVTGVAKVGLRDLRQLNQAEFLDAGAAVVGSAVGDLLPSQISLCITLRTALSGKSFRGRVYSIPLVEANSTPGGNVDTAGQTAILAFYTGVQTALSASQISWAVLSRPAYAYEDIRTWTLGDGSTESEVIGRGKARAGIASPVTAIASRSVAWETQRRRNNGRGGTAPAVLLGQQQVDFPLPPQP